MHVAIAGAGLMGRLLGHSLAKRGYTVELFERASREAPESAAHIAAAMLAPVSEIPDAEPEIFDMGRDSIARWPAILDALGVPYGIDGALFVAHGMDAPLLDKFHRSLGEHTDKARWISRTEIEALEPELGRQFQRGLFLRNEGWIDNRALLAALESTCGPIHFESAVDDLGALDGDVVVDCRGVGNDDPALRGVRGEVIRVSAPDVEIRRPVRLVHPRYQIYVSPRPGREYVIGATQIESASNARVSVRSALELLSAAFTLHSGFAEAEIIEMASGLRPAYPDHLPRVAWCHGVLSVNGCFRHGYLIGPTIVDRAVYEVESACRLRSTASRSS